MVKEDENVDVVYAALQGFGKIFKHVPWVAKMPVGAEAPVEMQRLSVNGAIIANIIKLVITEKVRYSFFETLIEREPARLSRSVRVF